MSDSRFTVRRVYGRGGESLGFCDYGGQIVSWRTRDERELLFLSDKAVFADGAAIRGGVPVIFPQFSDRGSLPKHGFARNQHWECVRAGVDGDAVIVEHRLCDDPGTKTVWPHSFEIRLRTVLRDERFCQRLVIENTGSSEFQFTAALHSYLLVADIESVGLSGFEHQAFYDHTAGGQFRDAEINEVAFGHEIDRIYAGAGAGALSLCDGENYLSLRARGFEDWVVWNPGQIKAEQLVDLAPGQWRRFVCIEAAQINRPVALAPGERWRGEIEMIAAAFPSGVQRDCPTSAQAFGEQGDD